jgi:hypothetical protein
MATKSEQINSFVEKRFQQDCNWTNGNCFYFATILKTRFPELDIYYLPITGHFVVGSEDIYYDYNGEVEIAETPILFSDLQTSDPIYYARILRDCVM